MGEEESKRKEDKIRVVLRRAPKFILLSKSNSVPQALNDVIVEKQVLGYLGQKLMKELKGPPARTRARRRDFR